MNCRTVYEGKNWVVIKCSACRYWESGESPLRKWHWSQRASQGKSKAKGFQGRGAAGAASLENEEPSMARLENGQWLCGQEMVKGKQNGTLSGGKGSQELGHVGPGGLRGLWILYKCSKKPLNGLKQGTDMTWLMCLKGYMEMDSKGHGEQPKEPWSNCASVAGTSPGLGPWSWGGGTS